MGTLIARLGGIAFAFALAGHCAAAGDDREQASASGASLELRVSTTADHLEVTYVVRNDGSDDIGLFNRLPGPLGDGRLGFPAERVYVRLQGSTLDLRKMVLGPPQGARAAEQTVPYITVVARGGRFEERFSLPIPIALDDQSVQALSGGAQPTQARATTVVFTVGLFPRTADTTLIPASSEYPDVYRVWPPGPAVDRQQTLSARASLEPPVPVRHK